MKNRFWKPFKILWKLVYTAMYCILMTIMLIPMTFVYWFSSKKFMEEWDKKYHDALPTVPKDNPPSKVVVVKKKKKKK